MTATTALQSLVPKIRYGICTLSVLVSFALGFGCVTERDLLGRIYLGVLWIGFSVFAWSVFHGESELANNHLCVVGKVELLHRTKVAVEVRYSYFVDGRNYETKSRLGKWSEFPEGTPIQVLFNPLRPEVSKPVRVFMFYRFENYL